MNFILLIFSSIWIISDLLLMNCQTQDTSGGLDSNLFSKSGSTSQSSDSSMTVSANEQNLQQIYTHIINMIIECTKMNLDIGSDSSGDPQQMLQSMEIKVIETSCQGIIKNKFAVDAAFPWCSSNSNSLESGSIDLSLIDLINSLTAAAEENINGQSNSLGLFGSSSKGASGSNGGSVSLSSSSGQKELNINSLPDTSGSSPDSSTGDSNIDSPSEIPSSRGSSVSEIEDTPNDVSNIPTSNTEDEDQSNSMHDLLGSDSLGDSSSLDSGTPDSSTPDSSIPDLSTPDLSTPKPSDCGPESPVETNTNKTGTNTKSNGTTPSDLNSPTPEDSADRQNKISTTTNIESNDEANTINTTTNVSVNDDSPTDSCESDLGSSGDTLDINTDKTSNNGNTVDQNQSDLKSLSGSQPLDSSSKDLELDSSSGGLNGRSSTISTTTSIKNSDGGTGSNTINSTTKITSDHNSKDQTQSCSPNGISNLTSKDTSSINNKGDGTDTTSNISDDSDSNSLGPSSNDLTDISMNGSNTQNTKTDIINSGQNQDTLSTGTTESSSPIDTDIMSGSLGGNSDTILAFLRASVSGLMIDGSRSSSSNGKCDGIEDTSTTLTIGDKSSSVAEANSPRDFENDNATSLPATSNDDVDGTGQTDPPLDNSDN